MFTHAKAYDEMRVAMFLLYSCSPLVLFLIHLFDIFVYLLVSRTYACVGDSKGKWVSPSGEDIQEKKPKIQVSARSEVGSHTNTYQRGEIG